MRPPASQRAPRQSGHAPRGGSSRRRRRALWAAALLSCLALVTAGYLWVLATSRPTFDGASAFQYLLKQCEFGPRNPGTEGHRRCLEYLTSELRSHGYEVRHQDFGYVSKWEPGRSLEGTNIWASLRGRGESGKRILLCAHWDTRPLADRDPDPANRARPILGANDGASGVGVLLELARVLAGRPPPVPVDILLFDLEDMGDLGTAGHSGGGDPFCIGSRHFVSQRPDYRPEFGILLDMVGKRGLKLRKEGFSLERAPRVVEKVWAAARRVGAPAFLDERGAPVYDDHVPFLERGIPVIDLIDLDYPAWHTVQDTPDKCSPDSLQQVGDVLLETIYAD